MFAQHQDQPLAATVLVLMGMSVRMVVNNHSGLESHSLIQHDSSYHMNDTDVCLKG